MAEQIGPMYARVGRADAPLIYHKDDLKDIKIGKGMVVKDGTDLSIIACGTMVEPALEAQSTLKKQGIKAQIIDMHTIKPIDKKLVLKCAKDTGAIITAEEHSIIGGLGAAVAEILADENISCKLHRMGIKDIFCESGDPAVLLEKYKLNENHIVKNAKEIIKN